MIDKGLRKDITDAIEQFCNHKSESSDFFQLLSKQYDDDIIYDDAVKAWIDFLKGKELFEKYDEADEKKDENETESDDEKYEYNQNNIIGDKQFWDFLQRSALFFKTDLPKAEFRRIIKKKSDFTQIISPMIFILIVIAITYISMANKFGWLFVVLILGFIIYGVLDDRRIKIRKKLEHSPQQKLLRPQILNLYPFSSREDIRNAKLKIRFKKKSYTKYLNEQTEATKSCLLAKIKNTIYTITAVPVVIFLMAIPFIIWPIILLAMVKPIKYTIIEMDD